MNETSGALTLYRGGTTVLSPFVRVFLRARARRGKEDRARIAERFGVAPIGRPPGTLIWLHAASVGESLALLPLIDRLRAIDLTVLLTTGTRASAQVMGTHLPGGVLHQYAPLDLSAALDAFLGHWRPALLVLAESEIWPNMLLACAARRTPIALVNGRLSERSARHWLRIPETSRALFGGLSLCLAQSHDHAKRLASLGARDVLVAGNLKYDRAPPPADPHGLASFRAAIGARPVVVAASTHPGEEAIVLDAHRRLQDRHPNLLTILVPRDISRTRAIVAEAHLGPAIITRSSGACVEARTQVLVADTFGEMGVWLRLATVAVIGKTFGDGGGQTPIEAAQCAAAIVYGPSTYQFAEAFDALDAQGGAAKTDGGGLAATIATLLDDPVMRSAMICAAAQTVESLAGASDRVMDALAPILAEARAA